MHTKHVLSFRSVFISEAGFILPFVWQLAIIYLLNPLLFKLINDAVATVKFYFILPMKKENVLKFFMIIDASIKFNVIKLYSYIFVPKFIT